MARKWYCPACGWQDNRSTTYVIKESTKIYNSLDKDIQGLVKKAVDLIRENIYNRTNYYHEEYKFMSGVKEFPKKVVKYSIRYYIHNECYMKSKSYNYLSAIMKNELNRIESLERYEKKYGEKQPPNVKQSKQR